MTASATDVPEAEAPAIVAAPARVSAQGSGDPELLREKRVTPMEAVDALYSGDDDDVAEAIIASLSGQIFQGNVPEPASGIKRLLAKGVFRLLKRTTRRRVKKTADGGEVIAFSNRILEGSGHPYAQTLLEPSGEDAATFVEGGDPMNAPYMMISPEIRKNALTWDRILLDSVQGKDVQLRFIWETKITYEIAVGRLKRGEPVRMKAAAAGTGLSMVLVYDRLIREGHDPRLISAAITDRGDANVAKTGRLLKSLATTRENIADGQRGAGISASVEDLLDAVPRAASGEDTNAGAAGDPAAPHVVTLIGILEYFHGFTCATTEEHLGLPASEKEGDAVELIRKVAETTAESGVLIANSYRVETGARILEVFGKQLRYRNRENLEELVESAGFLPSGASGSGHIYDVVAFEKRPGGQEG